MPEGRGGRPTVTVLTPLPAAPEVTSTIDPLNELARLGPKEAE